MQVQYFSDWQGRRYECPACGWSGPGEDADWEVFDGLIQVDCAKCDQRLFLVLLPTTEETKEAAARGNLEAQSHLRVLETREEFLSKLEASILTDVNALPDLPGDPLDFFLTTVGETWHVLVAGQPPLTGPEDPRILHKELAAYATTEPVSRIVPLLELKYGDRFRYLRVTGALLYLLGDDLSADRNLMSALGRHRAPDE